MNVRAQWTASTMVRYALAALLVFVVGVATRIAPRHWTELPFNPDGFRFAAQAEYVIAHGRVTIDAISSHGLGFPILLSQLQLVTDASALSLTQPTIAVIGTVPCLFAFVFGRRIARGRGWTPGQVLTVATVAGLVLATEGLYLRRTAAVSYEVLGILLVVTSAVAFHRLLATERSVWLVALLPCLVALPITHHLSTMMAALALTALAVVHVRRTPARTTIGHALVIVALFWVYFGTYYVLTRPPYFEDAATKPGLFLAWLVVLAGLVVLFRGSTSRTLRLAFALPFVGGFTVLAINAVTDVFPGTASTHPRVLLYVAPLTVLVALAVWGIPMAIEYFDVGPVVLALFLGPLVFVGFALTAGLSPEYRDFAARGQTFVHLSVVIMAALAVVDLGWRLEPRRQPALKTAVPALLLVCALVSMPLAFAGPPVLPYESTTTAGEFQTVTFADDHLDGVWTSDDHLTRVGNEYYSAGVSPGPTYEWLQGAGPPECPVLVQESWSSVGAQAFPADPISADAHDIDQVITTEHTVYEGGSDENHVIVTRSDPTDGCS